MDKDKVLKEIDKAIDEIKCKDSELTSFMSRSYQLGLKRAKAIIEECDDEPVFKGYAIVSLDNLYFKYVDIDSMDFEFTDEFEWAYLNKNKQQMEAIRDFIEAVCFTFKGLELFEVYGDVK